MEGRTTRETAIKIEASIKQQHHFIATVNGRECVIDATTWIPLNGNNGQSVSANPITPRQIDYFMTRKATPEEQELVDAVEWATA